VRDSQKSRVYDAEQVVRRVLDRAHEAPLIEIHNSSLVLPSEMRFGSLDGAQTYVDRIQASDWYRAKYPRATKIKVVQRKGNNLAHYKHGEVALHDNERRGVAWAMREIVVLHEMAHGVSTGDGHGSQFCAAFLFLVREVMGDVAWLVLYDAMTSNDCLIDHQTLGGES
jgi:putative metallohydrolase (TIGR04338 family)